MLSFIGGSPTDAGDAALDDDARPTVATNNLDLFVAFSSQTDDIPGELTAHDRLPGSTLFFQRLTLMEPLELLHMWSPNIAVVTQTTRQAGLSSRPLVRCYSLAARRILGLDYPIQNSAPASAFFDGTHGGWIDIILNFFTSSDTLPTTFSGFVGGGFNDYLGDTGIVQGGGHYDYNPTTGVVTLATTVHSQLAASVIPGPGGTSFDFTKNAPGAGDVRGQSPHHQVCD